jgi:hypothetical protein
MELLCCVVLAKDALALGTKSPNHQINMGEIAV